MDWLTDPWQYEFMQRALWAGLLVSAAGAVVGAFVVVKGLAFMSDAVAHSSLAGASVAFVGGGGSTAISIGAVVAALVTAVGVATLTRTSRLREDTAIALLFAAFFAFAILLISSTRNYALDLNSFIVGNILGVAQGDLVVMGVLTAIVLAVTAFSRAHLHGIRKWRRGVPVALVQTPCARRTRGGDRVPAGRSGPGDGDARGAGGHGGPHGAADAADHGGRCAGGRVIDAGRAIHLLPQRCRGRAGDRGGGGRVLHHDVCR